LEVPIFTGLLVCLPTRELHGIVELGNTMVTMAFTSVMVKILWYFLGSKMTYYYWNGNSLQ